MMPPACEALLQQLHRERGLPLVILRPGIVLGPGSPPTHPGVAQFVTETHVQYWGDGRNAWLRPGLPCGCLRRLP